MKKSLSFLSSILLISTLLCGCVSTLQEDIILSSELSKQAFESVYEYETAFMNFDSMKAQGLNVPQNELAEFESKVNLELKKSYLEPAARARLYSFLGLTSLFRKNTKQAENFYKAGKSCQAGDEYVTILGIRLENKLEDRLSKIEEAIEKDSKNGILLLEKGKLLYSKRMFDNAVATFDSAFLILDSKETEINNYREIYSVLRDKAWSFYSSGIESNAASVLISENYLSKEMMVNLTVENSSLVEDFMGGTRMSSSELIAKMTSAGFFSSAADSDNLDNSADELLTAGFMSRKLCARYLWNLYVLKKGKKSLLTRYSKRYSQMENAQSPIHDIEISNPDFDAAVGVVEAEIMPLPDGLNFYPDDNVSPVEFLSYLKSVDR